MSDPGEVFIETVVPFDGTRRLSPPGESIQDVSAEKAATSGPFAVETHVYDRLVRLNQPPVSIRPLFVAIPAILIVVCTLVAAVALQRPAVDAQTYLAAGERLNAGHDLYALAPGDRPVPLLPPYWTVPLLSPPSIAVVWRPLAALPSDLGLLTWWAGLGASMGLALFSLLRRGGIFAALLVSLLALPIGSELAAANVNGYLLAGLVLAWRWRGREAAGALVAIMSAVKLVPAVLIVWFVGRGARRSLLGLVVAGFACLAVSLAVAGIDAHIRYLEIAGTAYPAPLSLPALTGIPSAAMVFLIGASAACVVASPRFPGLAFGLAVAAMVLGSPVVNITTFSLLAAIAAPAAFPADARPAPTNEQSEPVEPSAIAT